MKNSSLSVETANSCSRVALSMPWGRFLGGSLTKVGGRDEGSVLLSLVFGDCVQSDGSAQYPWYSLQTVRGVEYKVAQLLSVFELSVSGKRVVEFCQ